MDRRTMMSGTVGMLAGVTGLAATAEAAEKTLETCCSDCTDCRSACLACVAACLEEVGRKDCIRLCLDCADLGHLEFLASGNANASRRRPLYPRAPASNIATAWCLRLSPAGFGSGRGSVPAKHGPQPASMRAAPAFRDRLSDVEAATPAVSVAQVGKLTAG